MPLYRALSTHLYGTGTQEEKKNKTSYPILNSIAVPLHHSPFLAEKHLDDHEPGADENTKRKGGFYARSFALRF